MRFLCGVKGAIENRHFTLAIKTVAVGTVRSKICIHLLDIIRRERLVLEIPSSKLDAHETSLCRSGLNAIVVLTGARPTWLPGMPSRVDKAGGLQIPDPTFQQHGPH